MGRVRVGCLPSSLCIRYAAGETYQPARFHDTNDEERQENIDNLVLEEYDGEDRTTIDLDREDPQLPVGTIFQSMVDCHNAVTTYCTLTENTYVIDNVEPTRFTVHCPYDRCRWRLHASGMLRSKFIQIAANAEENATLLQIEANTEENEGAKLIAANVEENEATELALLARVALGKLEEKETNGQEGKNLKNIKLK
ncbi:hypothetical protein D1007_23003 [Hordeum vulgare]|nr:hypothetical protein D1007_23003 [Hordeum vulgare]